MLGSKKAFVFLKKHGIKSALLQCVDEKGEPFEKRFGINIGKVNAGKK
jgi:hypothetical protein